MCSIVSFVSSFAQVKATTVRDEARLVSVADDWAKPGGTAVSCYRSATQDVHREMQLECCPRPNRSLTTFDVF